MLSACFYANNVNIEQLCERFMHFAGHYKLLHDVFYLYSIYRLSYERGDVS